MFLCYFLCRSFAVFQRNSKFTRWWGYSQPSLARVMWPTREVQSVQSPTNWRGLVFGLFFANITEVNAKALFDGSREVERKFHEKGSGDSDYTICTDMEIVVDFPPTAPWLSFLGDSTHHRLLGQDTDRKDSFECWTLFYDYRNFSAIFYYSKSFPLLGISRPKYSS